MHQGIFCALSFLILGGALGEGNGSSEEQFSFRSPKIINGDGAPRGKYPSQAMLFRDGLFLCGGTIVDEHHILTAAHCIVGAQAVRRYTVVLGKHIMNDDVGSDQYRKVDRMIMYEEYDLDTNAHDIAVIRLKGAIQYNQYVQPVTMADDDSNVNRRCYASGFGLVRQNPDVLANTLQELRSRVVSRSKCIRIAGKYGVAELISDSVLCTKDRKAGVCSGDSGGPLGCFVNGSYTQIGVLSFGSTTCLKGFNIYTKVSEYRDWISSKTTGK